MGLKKEFAIMHLFELQILNFVELPSPHALNRNSRDIDETPTYSILSKKLILITLRRMYGVLFGTRF